MRGVFAHGFFAPRAADPPKKGGARGGAAKRGARGATADAGRRRPRPRPASVERAGRDAPHHRSAPRAKAPDSGSVAGGDSRGLKPVEFA